MRTNGIGTIGLVVWADPSCVTLALAAAHSVDSANAPDGKNIKIDEAREYKRTDQHPLLLLTSHPFPPLPTWQPRQNNKMILTCCLEMTASNIGACMSSHIRRGFAINLTISLRRLNVQHFYLLKHVYDDKYIYDESVVLGEGSHVLDAGTGTGE